MFFRVNIRVKIDCLIRSLFSGVSMEDFNLLQRRKSQIKSEGSSITFALLTDSEVIRNQDQQLVGFLKQRNFFPTKSWVQF